MPDYVPITAESATQRILDSERAIAGMFRHYFPGEVIMEASRRFRDLERPGARLKTPPHCMIHAIEASCAYFKRYSYRPLTREDFAFLANSLMGTDDPGLEVLIQQGGMSLIAYMERTQLLMQRKLWVVPLGRAAIMFADPHALPRIGAEFARCFGLTPRQWVQMALMVHAATSVRKNQMGFQRNYIEHLAKSEIPVSAAEAFLEQTSVTPMEIGNTYLRVRYGDREADPFDPLTWYQRSSSLAQRPIVRFTSGWVVPAPGLLIPLFEDLLIQRLVSVATGSIREELSDQFVEYIVSVFNEQLPAYRIVRENLLRGRQGGKVVDLAIELPNAILLIEAKSITFDRDLLTEKALLAGPVREIVDGAIQIAETANRITDGSCPAASLPPGKPIVGLIATLGHFPHVNNERVFEAGASEFAKRELVGDNLTPALYCRPFTLGPNALESLAIYLKSRPSGLLDLVDEKSHSDINQVGDWPLFLNEKVSSMRCDLSRWRNAFHELLAEFGIAK